LRDGIDLRRIEHELFEPDTFRIVTKELPEIGEALSVLGFDPFNQLEPDKFLFGPIDYRSNGQSEFIEGTRPIV
jgi:hypothetical protein